MPAEAVHRQDGGSDGLPQQSVHELVGVPRRVEGEHQMPDRSGHRAVELIDVLGLGLAVDLLQPLVGQVSVGQRGHLDHPESLRVETIDPGHHRLPRGDGNRPGVTDTGSDQLLHQEGIPLRQGSNSFNQVGGRRLLGESADLLSDLAGDSGPKVTRSTSATRISSETNSDTAGVDGSDVRLVIRTTSRQGPVTRTR